MSAVRLVTLDDAPVVAGLLRANHAHLAPWEPVRADSYSTDAGQLDVLADALVEWDAGRAVPFVILDGDQVVGRITLSGIVRGPFLSCTVGYWLAASATGRGLATTALREVVAHAFGRLGLHRVEASTMLSNTRSERVLTRAGFTPIGLAPRYLHLAGQWQDCRLHQLLAE